MRRRLSLVIVVLVAIGACGRSATSNPPSATAVRESLVATSTPTSPTASDAVERDANASPGEIATGHTDDGLQLAAVTLEMRQVRVVRHAGPEERTEDDLTLSGKPDGANGSTISILGENTRDVAHLVVSKAGLILKSSIVAEQACTWGDSLVLLPVDWRETDNRTLVSRYAAWWCVGPSDPLVERDPQPAIGAVKISGCSAPY